MTYLLECVAFTICGLFRRQDHQLVINQISCFFLKNMDINFPLLAESVSASSWFSTTHLKLVHNTNVMASFYFPDTYSLVDSQCLRNKNYERRNECPRKYETRWDSERSMSSLRLHRFISMRLLLLLGQNMSNALIRTWGSNSSWDHRWSCWNMNSPKI